MKIRNGFVSNSSSSSFIVRGVRVKKEDLAKNLKVKLDKLDYISNDLPKGIEAKSTRYYFGGDETDDILIGMSFDSDDGNVTEIHDDPERDEKIVKALNKIGFKDIKLSTFFQYVSNDNC